MKTLKDSGAIIWALTANILIAVMKFVCAALGSVAMLSEGVHSVADSANELTLMVGKKFSKKEPSRKHPWGTSRGRYLASFIVAVLLFLAGGAYSSYEAIEKMIAISHMGVRTVDVSTLRISLITCIVAAILEGLSLHKGINEAHGRFVKTHEYGKFNLWRFWTGTKSSDLAAVIAEDVLACVSLAIAGSCTAMALITGDELWDGIGGLGVGIILIIGSVLLALQVSSLLLGEGVSDHTYDTLERIIMNTDGVKRLIRIQAMHLDEDRVLCCIKVDMHADRDNNAVIDDIERRIRSQITWYDFDIVIETDRYDPNR